MTARRRALSLLAAVALLVACDPQTATAPTGDLTLVAHFDDVQDLTRGHTVQAANVVIGSVREVALDGHRARVELSIVDGRAIPAGTSAVVRRTSFLGEYFVDLVFPPDATEGPFLRSGDEIEITETERDLEQLAEQAALVIGSVTGDDIAGVVQAGADAIGGRGATINAAVDDAHEILAVLAGQSQQIGQAIDDLAAFGATVAPASDDIAALLVELAAATQTVGASRGRIVDSVEALVALAGTTSEVILEPHGQRLSQTLAELNPLLGDLAGRSEVLADLIVDFRRFGEVFPSAIHNGQILLLTWAYLDAATLGLAPPSSPPPSAGSEP